MRNTLLTIMVLGLATWLALFMGGNFPLLGTSIMAILIGAIIRHTPLFEMLDKTIIRFVSSYFLKTGIVLLGFTLSLRILTEVGFSIIFILIAVIAVSVLTSLLVNKGLKINGKLALLVGIGTAICGGSAIVAAAPILEAEDEDIAVSVTTMFVYSMLALLFLPTVGKMLGFTDQLYGILAGVAVNETSRREADRLIEAGRVTINGLAPSLGTKVESGDDVRIDGKPVHITKEYVYLALNKPVGITSTTNQAIKGNIVDLVNHPLRVFHVGRLDKDSEGLILMTNDGDIVNEILRVENRHEKEYIVTVDRPITPAFLKKMSAGVKILGTTTLPCKMEQQSKYVFKIILTQGLNRQIRRMCAELGYGVKALQRIRIMNIHLGDLPVGTWRDLTEQERSELFAELDYTPKS